MGAHHARWSVGPAAEGHCRRRHRFRQNGRIQKGEGGDMQQLQGRVAVVTGAASGIGLAMATRFARAGMKLVLADIEAAALQRALAQLQSMDAQALAVTVDVADAASVERLAEAAYAGFGAVHLLCNNAGVTAPALLQPTWQNSLQDWHWVLAVNLMGVVHGVRSFVPRMLAGGDEGHVVNTASVAGLITGSGPYFASKHALSCLTEGLYKDFKLAGAKLSASVLCPGVIRTQILDAERNRPAAFGGPTDPATLGERDRQWVAGFRAALEAGIDPAVVAEAVHDAVVHDRYYIVPAQDEHLQRIRTRMADIAALRNPTLPAPGA
jgi:NAD(P)-dependent dehydrogenase (short-subunit alcohol dehydrogenase family)